jgi:hypothetical protein
MIPGISGGINRARVSNRRLDAQCFDNIELYYSVAAIFWIWLFASANLAIDGSPPRSS